MPDEAASMLDVAADEAASIADVAADEADCIADVAASDAAMPVDAAGSAIIGAGAGSVTTGAGAGTTGSSFLPQAANEMAVAREAIRIAVLMVLLETGLEILESRRHADSANAPT